MNVKQVDVAIIGTGSAGMGAYREARKHTDRIALIEGYAYGTTCARVGCMPSKLLIAAAESAHHARHTDLFGVRVDNVRVDSKAVMERVRFERDRFVNFVLEDVNDFDEAHKIWGFARFQDDHTLRVDDHTEIHADRIVIAVGSRPNLLPIFKNAEDRLFVNDDVFEFEDLPDSIMVMGTGVIGLELGQALSRLGVRVTMLGRSESIGGIADETMRRYAAKTFSEEFDLQLGATVTDIERTASGVHVAYTNQRGENIDQDVDAILVATGRVSNTDKLALENTRLLLDEQGIPQFNPSTMQTDVEHIFIAGDANNELPLLHEASDEGRIAGANAGRFPQVEKGRRRAPLAVVFSEPQIASVGKTSRELEGTQYVVGEVSFEGQGRSRVMGRNKGLLKVYADKISGVLLGAEMFGPSAEHVGHLLSWAVQQRLTVADILAMPFYHPVIEEGVRTAFRDVAKKL